MLQSLEHCGPCNASRLGPSNSRRAASWAAREASSKATPETFSMVRRSWCADIRADHRAAHVWIPVQAFTVIGVVGKARFRPERWASPEVCREQDASANLHRRKERAKRFLMVSPSPRAGGLKVVGVSGREGSSIALTWIHSIETCPSCPGDPCPCTTDYRIGVRLPIIGGAIFGGPGRSVRDPSSRFFLDERLLKSHRRHAAMRGSTWSLVGCQSRFRSSAMSPITPITVPRMMIAASM